VAGISDRMTSSWRPARRRRARAPRPVEFDRLGPAGTLRRTGGERLRAALEDHGGGAQLLRVRSWPAFALAGRGYSLRSALRRRRRLRARHLGVRAGAVALVA
jgi:hypothetical protein